MRLWLQITFIVAVALLSTTVRADELSPQTAEQIRDLLDIGFERGTHALPAVKAMMEPLQNSGEIAPELAYAYGLVLIKQFKAKDAVVQLRRAADDPDDPYWPAWHALIWTHFSAKETTAGYDRVFDFAKRLKSAPLDQQKESARWLGQLFAALETIAESAKAQETVPKHDQRLRELLGADLQNSYEEGRLDTADKSFVLDREVAEIRQEQLVKNQEAQKEQQTKIVEDTEAAKKKTESVKKSADDWKRWLDDQFKQFDRLLDWMEKDYGLLERRAQAFVETQQQIDREILAIRNNADRFNAAAGNRRIGSISNPARFGGTIVNSNIELETRIDFLIGQKMQYQGEFDRTRQEAFALSQRAALVIKQRDATIQKYQQATGQLIQQAAAIEKWQGRLKKNGEKLKSPATAKGGAVSRTVAKTKSLNTYLEFDVEDERLKFLERLQAQFPAPMKDAEAAK